MPASNLVQEQTGTRFFCAGRLLPLVDAFSGEISGVRAAQDIEYIHRMRVASRRLRAALPLFAVCFPKKKYLAWIQAIKTITRALGKARDMDVQIAFLIKYQKSISTTKKGATGKDTTPQTPSPDAISELLVRLQKRRGHLQDDVIRALDTFERRKVVPEIQECLRQMLPANKRFRRRPSLSGIPLVAAERITNRLAALSIYEPWVHNPHAVAEHHALRIAAKKLRYTMEIYAPLYRLGLHKPLRQVKRLQDILGDVHDCDVWIDHLTLDITRQRARLDTPSGASVSGAAAIPDLKQLLVNREKKRQALYRRFVRFWDSLCRANFANTLRQTMVNGRRVICAPRRVGLPEAEEAEVNRLAGLSGEAQAHCAHVAGLSLMLFDALRPIHGLSDRDRSLLRYAGLLHDPGETTVSRGDHNRSDRVILAYEELPFDFIEQGIIGLVVRFHHQKPGKRKGGLFALFSDVDQNRVMALAALLRIADALDFRHLGVISALKISMSPGEIGCEISSLEDSSIEKARAQAKSDLFVQAFQKPVVFR